MRRISILLSAAAFMMVMMAMTVGPAAVTFSNNNGITINDSITDCSFDPAARAMNPAQADPYPSQISVSGFASSVSDVNVTVSGLSHTFPDDIGLLLVSPVGKSTILMTDNGGFPAVSGINLTFDDSAPGTLPDQSQLSGGTYLPSRGDGWRVRLRCSGAIPGCSREPVRLITVGIQRH